MSTDYKIMKNLVCKGGEPSLMTVKEEQENPLLANMDVEQHKTKMEKEIGAQKKAKMDEEEKEKENARRLKEASERFDHGEADEASEGEEEEERPTGIIQPKYKLVHSFPVDMGDSWGGFQTAEMEHANMVKAKVPTHLTVTIHLKWADSMKGANLDINETTLLFEYPDIYYLDLNLKYKTDPDQGSAKFDKSTKKLVIKLPIVGLTEDSQKVMDEHYKAFVTDKKETMSSLQVQGEVQDDQEQTTNDSERGSPEENQLREEALARLSQMQSSGGLSTGRDFGDMNGGPIDDKYNLEQNTDEIRKKMLANQDEDDTQDGFLKVYDENKNAQALEGEAEPLTKDQVKFRQAGEEPDLNLQMPGQPDGARPQIQELSSTSFEAESQKAAALKQQQEEEAAKVVVPPFSWDDAERVEAKHTFVNQGDMVFATFHFKGYDKEKDVRYALSDDEVLLEVRDVAKNKVHRVCSTLLHKIDARESSI